MRLIAYYLIGLVFGTGIALSGMMNPAKVTNFFDVAGHWDPSLAFVMGGALIVTFVGYRVVLKRPAPIFAETFHLPTSSVIDGKLITGSAIFGIGWGITGFCPGGAIPAIGTGRLEVIAFVAALTAGIILARAYTHRRTLISATQNS